MGALTLHKLLAGTAAGAGVHTWPPAPSSHPVELALPAPCSPCLQVHPGRAASLCECCGLQRYSTPDHLHGQAPHAGPSQHLPDLPVHHDQAHVPDTGTGVGGAGLDKPRCGSVMVQQADGACRELHLLSAAPPATGVPALAATPPPSLRLLTDHGAALPLYADCPRVPWRGQGVLHLVRERCRSSPKPLYAVSVIAQAAEMLSGCATPRAM